MSAQNMYAGDLLLKQQSDSVAGAYVKLDGEDFYKISNYDLMRPFFISLVSHSDLWLFTSTTGGLSAGRRNEESALFPYYTDDKISESSETTGSKTIIQSGAGSDRRLWEPFSERYAGVYTVSRNLYKNVAGTKIIFEEINHDLALQFQYSWRFSEQYGLVKRSEITNLGEANLNLRVLDGIQNLVPYGVSTGLQNLRSNLAHAYKRNELDAASGLGIFALSSMIVDKAEPSEALKATTVWSAGAQVDCHLLSGLQLRHFRKGLDLTTETDVKAEPGSYFIQTTLDLAPQADAHWYLVAEVNQDHAAIHNLMKVLKGDAAALIASLDEDIEKGTQSLLQLVGMADGLQLTNDKLSVGRHYSNVLFNIMRGGIFDDQYRVEKSDLLEYAEQMNAPLVDRTDFFQSLEDELDYNDLLKRAQAVGDADIARLCYEYLPLTFSRRHGDPSRPWNKFSIETRREDGAKLRNYQGNWRDIFQNWEALSLSFPAFLTSMIAKFVNASTIDGYNPYRISREGIDWEVIEPDDPWSYIGYWGDHQIIYLLKLMELAQAHAAGAFQELLSRPEFVYANVPYRIKWYDEIVRDPQDTIDFDDDAEHKIQAIVDEIGGDGKLVRDAQGELIRSNLTEKLLLTLLTKLSNFVPEAGIWLNTQRPEWNDANNALVGNGVSMVTLYYVRRYLTFCKKLFSDPGTAYDLNAPVADLLHGIHGVFEEHKAKLDGAFSDEQRKVFVDALGRLGETYRAKAYHGFDGMQSAVDGNSLGAFFDVALAYVDHSIRANKRADGLYHAYNIIQFQGQKLTISYLYEMLEGQVAVLSAGLLSAAEALEVLDALKASAIYREDQFSYMLYPNRELPKFLEKNHIPESFVSGSKLAAALLKASDASLISKDEDGHYHFNGNFHNANDVREALDHLKATEAFGSLAQAEYDAYLGVFEEMFDHKSFTGRSGTFFGYEGLGSIYWHMVSKLLLSVQENIYWAGPEYAGSKVMGKLMDHYYEIRAGIGINKSPELYGAFPTDPYSHTPGSKGAQQPGMTGQVKEDVLNRWAELGIGVEEGKIHFNPILFHSEELVPEASVFTYFDVHGTSQQINLDAGQLAFTYCQVLVIYQAASEQKISIHSQDGQEEEIATNEIPEAISKEIFARSGRVNRIVYQFPVN